LAILNITGLPLFIVSQSRFYEVAHKNVLDFTKSQHETCLKNNNVDFVF